MKSRLNVKTRLIRHFSDGLVFAAKFWSNTLLMSITMMICIAACVKCSGQSFVPIATYPYVVTSIKYDELGNEYVLRHQGDLTRNGEIIGVFSTMWRDECGAVDFCFIEGGVLVHLSSPDSTQRILRLDTFTGDIDTLLTVPYKNPFTDNHRGGSVAYHNGIAYASFGYGAIPLDAQDITNYRGKLVKIDVNTLVTEISVFGLRNPYRFAYHPEFNEGYIADVGSDIAEEINYFTGDYSLLNDGWPCFEGDSQLVASDTLCDLCGGYAFSFPEFIYSKPTPKSIIGGCFWNNNYYFCDHFRDDTNYVYGGWITPGWEIYTFPISFPQHVTSMTTNHQNELIVSTWEGGIYKYEEPPLGFPEDTIEEEEPLIDYWIRKYGDVYITIEGKIFKGVPDAPGVYYSYRWRRWIPMFYKT